MIRDDINQKGYSQEEAYFYRQNQKIIDSRREILDSKKNQLSDRSRMPYWMRCPKCGEQMKEIDLSGIKIDQCSICQGIYFDAGEIQTLMATREPKGFFGFLRKKTS